LVQLLDPGFVQVNKRYLLYQFGGLDGDVLQDDLLPVYFLQLVSGEDRME